MTGVRGPGAAEPPPGRPHVAGGRFALPAVRGLVRQRVLGVLRQAVDEHPVTLVVAPAGSGKTTALVQLANATDDRHTWYRTASAEATPEALLRNLARALGHVVHDLDTAWESVDDAISALAATPDSAPTLLLVDDLHELAGSAAEATFEHLVRDLPAWLRIVAATRHMPGFNHSSLRVSEQMTEITEDVLRWRPWEVERLFRDFYRMRLRPEDAARLTQRTEGWAAGLQLFHLASQHLPGAERRRLIDDLHTRPGLVREYLTQNVLAGLPSLLRQFMVDTCVLGRLDAPLCDELRAATDSSVHLSRLEVQRLFLVPREDGRGFRYHEVLRAHLELSLLERDGPAATRARYRRAGHLLEADGAVAEALHAYTRAECWDDAIRLLGTDGSSVAERGPAILGHLPASLVASDPWLQLAQARVLLGDGRLLTAIDAYRDAEQAFGHHPAARICQDELAVLQTWAGTADGPPRSTAERLRAAVRHDPRRHATTLAALGTPGGELAAAVGMLLAGSADEARRLARAAGSRPEAEVFMIGAARAIEHLADLIAGAAPDPGDLLSAAETFEHLGTEWLARLARAIATCHTEDGVEEALQLRELLEGRGDPWGPALLALVAGIASVVQHDPRVQPLEDAARAFRALGAGTLEAWAQAWAALGEVDLDTPEAPSSAEQARSLARSVQVPGAEAIAELALARGDGPMAGDARARAAALARELGMALPPPPTPLSMARVEVKEPAGIHLSCFGGLVLRLPHGPVDLSTLRPQGRTVVARLAMQAGSQVHRDQLVDALWPDDDLTTSLRRLPVVISTVRRHLEPDVEAGNWQLLRRRGDAYVLDLPAHAHVDVRAFDRGIAAARRGHAERDLAAEIAGHRAALMAYGGDLLPEFGAADWLVDERDHYRVQFARSATALAGWHLEADEPAACVEVAQAGLRADRYRSRLWRTLAAAHRTMGDEAAAARADADHADVLAELGVQVPAEA